jgi:uroporphyrinogen III methyltransferase/synthase
MHPLNGLRIVVTRAVHQAEELAAPLREQGATVILLPVIGIGPPADPQPLAKAIANLKNYDWIIFTSVNGIRAFGKHECQAHIATVGAATREFAEKQGYVVSVTPETYVAEALVEALGAEKLEGRRVLIPSAAVTRDVVREELQRRGALVDQVEAYRNVMPPEAATLAGQIFREPWPDWITFASSSAVENFISLAPLEKLPRSKIASIGPVTSKTIRDHGLHVDVEAQPHKVTGLVNAIVHAVCSATA